MSQWGPLVAWQVAILKKQRQLSISTDKRLNTMCSPLSQSPVISWPIPPATDESVSPHSFIIWIPLKLYLSYSTTHGDTAYLLCCLDHVSITMMSYNNIPDRNNLRKKRFILTHSVDGHGGEAMAAGTRRAGHHHSQEIEGDELQCSGPFFVLSPGPQTLGWYYLHLGWLCPPNLPTRDTLS